MSEKKKTKRGHLYATDSDLNFVREVQRKYQIGQKEALSFIVNEWKRLNQSVSEKLPTFKLLASLFYNANCFKCCKDVAKGSSAWGAKTDSGWVFMCLDCQFELSKMSDPNIAKLVVSKRDLKREIRALKKESNRLADDLSDAIKLDNIHEELCLRARETKDDKLRSEIHKALAIIQDWKAMKFKKSVISRIVPMKVSVDGKQHSKSKTPLPPNKVRCGYTRRIVDKMYCENECKYKDICRFKSY